MSFVFLEVVRLRNNSVVRTETECKTQVSEDFKSRFNKMKNGFKTAGNLKLFLKFLGCPCKAGCKQQQNSSGEALV